MAKHLVFLAVCLFLGVQLTLSAPSPKRVARQSDVAFPDDEQGGEVAGEGEGGADVENRFNIKEFFGFGNNKNQNNNQGPGGNNNNNGRPNQVPGPNNGRPNQNQQVPANNQNRPGGNANNNGRPNPQVPANNQNRPGGNNNDRPTQQLPTQAPTPAATTPAPAPRPDCLLRCPVTPEYNPVCGSNRQTYTNPSRLECARQCGLPAVQFLRLGSCPPAAAS